jgi:hypothetical protein
VKEVQTCAVSKRDEDLGAKIGTWNFITDQPLTPIVYLSTDSTISTKAVILHKVTDQKVHLDNPSHKYTFLLIFVKKISWTKIAESL